MGDYGYLSTPRISEVRVTFEDPVVHGGVCIPEADDTITIWGHHFGQRRAPVVALGDLGELVVCKYNATEIVVRCPEGTCEDGDYRLKVTPKKER